MRGFKRNACRFALLTLLLTLLFTAAAYAGTIGTGVGTVNASSLRVRSWDSTKASIVTTLKENTTVTVLGQIGDWYQINYNGKDGYVAGEYLDVANQSDALSTCGKIVVSCAHVRLEPKKESATLFDIPEGEYVDVKGFRDGWFFISYGEETGYVRSDLLVLTNSKASSIAEELIDYAKSFLGVRYKYGGTTAKGFDCSGFTMFVFKNFGISLPHSATSQLGNGEAVALADLEPGDLIFFRDTNYSTKAASHVGIYIGNSDFIHASSSRSGKYVIISSLKEAYHASVATEGRRVLS